MGSPYRTPPEREAKPPSIRDLMKLARAYESRQTRGTTMLSLLCAGLVPMTHAATWAVIAFCWVPSLVALVFIVIGAAERVAQVPSEVVGLATHLGVRRLRWEPRHKWLERIVLAEMTKEDPM